MYPTIRVGNLLLDSHVAMMCLAAVVSGALIVRGVAARDGVGVRNVLLVVLLLALAAFVGGRAHFAINAWSFSTLSKDWIELAKFWKGLHAPGALVGLALIASLTFWALRIPAGRFLDTLVPAGCVGIAVARIGCFLAGCCFGRPCTGPFCLAFPPDSPAQRFHLRLGLIETRELWSAEIHPFPLYLAAIALTAAIVGYASRRYGAYDGQAALFSGALYLVGAGAVEPLRENYYPASYSWAGAIQFEWLGLGLAAAAVVTVVGVEGLRSWREARRPAPQRPNAPPTRAGWAGSGEQR